MIREWKRRAKQESGPLVSNLRAPGAISGATAVPDRDIRPFRGAAIALSAPAIFSLQKIE